MIRINIIGKADSHPAAQEGGHMAVSTSRHDPLDSFLECRSQTALGCLAEGVIDGFWAGITAPLWILSACSEVSTYGEFVPTDDAMDVAAQATDKTVDGGTDATPLTDTKVTRNVPDANGPEVESDIGANVGADVGVEVSVPSPDISTSEVAASPVDGKTLIDSEQLNDANINPSGIPTQLKGVVSPNGNGCYTAGNTIPFSVTLADADHDSIKVSLNLYHNTKLLNGVINTFDYDNYGGKKPVVLDLPASYLNKGASEYCYDFTLDDGKGGVVTTEQNCFISGEKGLLGLWTFNEMGGTVAHDWSYKNITTDGVLVGNTTWTVVAGAKMLCLGGNGAHVKIVPPDEWKYLEKLSFKARFSVNSKNNPDTFIVSWSKDQKTSQDGLSLRVQGGVGIKDPVVVFGLCRGVDICENAWDGLAKAKWVLQPNLLYDVTGTFNTKDFNTETLGVGTANLYIPSGDKFVTTTQAITPTTQLGSSLLFGKLASAPPLTPSFIGCIDEIAFYNTDLSEPCQ